MSGGSKDHLAEHRRRIEQSLGPFRAKLDELRPGARDGDETARGDDANVGLELRTLADGTVDFAAPGDPDDGDEPDSRTPIGLSDLPGNTLHEGLRALDGVLTPHQGLRRLDEEGQLVPATERFEGRTLLVVHGTFSNSDNVIAGIGRGDPEFLRWARESYDQVLTFDYASLSNRTVATAMILQRIVGQQVHGDVDLLCHSQGGLVARYWLERFEPARLERSRVVLVGSPLAGTSLAAPANLRRATRMLATAASVIGVGASVVAGAPLLGAVGGLMGVVHKSVGLAASGLLFDAAIAVVPGLDSMSRVSTNVELRELRRSTTGVPPAYFVVSGDSAGPPETEGGPKRAALIAIERMRADIFGGDNDIIVDTSSHTELSDAHVIGRDDPGRVHFYARSRTIHHRNYFSQPDALEFIARRLDPGRSSAVG